MAHFLGNKLKLWPIKSDITTSRRALGTLEAGFEPVTSKLWGWQLFGPFSLDTTHFRIIGAMSGSIPIKGRKRKPIKMWWNLINSPLY